MQLLNTAASETAGAIAEPLGGLDDFDHRVLVLRRHLNLLSSFLEDLHVQATHKGLAEHVLEPLAEAAESVGVEAVDALRETCKRIRTEYADIIEKAERGVDLTFLSQTERAA